LSYLLFQIFPYSSVEFFASWTDTKYDKVVVALLNTETSSHTYLSHTYLSKSYQDKSLSALTLSNCDQYNLVISEFNRKTEEICVQFSQLNAKHGFDSVDRFCLPVPKDGRKSDITVFNYTIVYTCQISGKENYSSYIYYYSPPVCLVKNAFYNFGMQ